MPESTIISASMTTMSPSSRWSTIKKGSYSVPRMQATSQRISSVVSSLAFVLGGTNKRANSYPYSEIGSAVLRSVLSLAIPRLGGGFSVLAKQPFDTAKGLAVQISAPSVVAVSISTDLSKQ